MKTGMKTSMTSFSLGGYEGQTSQAMPNDGDSLSPLVAEIASRLAILEGRLPIPAVADSVENDVLTLDANLRPRWEAGSSLGDGDHEGQLLVWHIDEITEEGSWIPYLPTSNIMLWFDATGTGEWKELTIPTEGAKVVRTDETSTVKFDYPIYSDGA
jgi:hypothetical protein